ncbi:hypothetical protein DFJ64_0632 [Thermasporomyces composti]|uniref:Uncharacterized protein n=1 Tax=Thermasporomyces composti TaxID=696763 RepID=A0A3D9V0H7_THECX|nr:hypothetical protein DFJ64_0632 [Thermasporomyces composti]
MSDVGQPWTPALDLDAAESRRGENWTSEAKHPYWQRPTWRLWADDRPSGPPRGTPRRGHPREDIMRWKALTFVVFALLGVIWAAAVTWR